MPRRSLAGCFHLPCMQKKFPVKNDGLDLHLPSNEDCLVKNDLLKLTAEELRQFTSQFSPENLVGVTNLGKLYRGKMPIGSDQAEVTKDVAVKILYRNQMVYRFIADDRLERFEYELKFLQDPSIIGNPNLVKVIGYCRDEETLGIVYDLNPQDTLENLIARDDFNWLQRVKIALSLARLLKYLHDRKYLIRNFAPHHIVVDQNFTPIMFEFGMLVGGVLGNTIDESDMRFGQFGYIDRYLILYGVDTFTVRSDVFAMGVLLLNFISKRTIVERKQLDTELDTWALEEFKSRSSLVHQSLEGDPGFYPLDGAKITELAVQCVQKQSKKRPNMKQVVGRLEALRVVQEHGL